jgi:four helix bundle protein
LKEACDIEFGFERLEVWKRAMAFSSSVYRLTRSFPREELFGLTSQLRRAVVSIPANIAEGASRTTGKDQARFFEIAFGSLNEVSTLLHIARDQEMLSADDFRAARGEICEIGRMLSGLKRAALA